MEFFTLLTIEIEMYQIFRAALDARLAKCVVIHTSASGSTTARSIASAVILYTMTPSLPPCQSV